MARTSSVKMDMDDEATFIAAMKMKVVKEFGYMGANALRAKWIWYSEGDSGHPPVNTAYTDGKIIAFCREYFQGKAFDEAWKVAAHETGHYSLGHPERMKVLWLKEKDAYNQICALLAADHVVNTMLNKLPAHSGTSVMPKDGFICPPEWNIPENVTFEQVYHLLKKKAKEQGGGGGKGKGKPEKGEGEHEGHGHGDGSELGESCGGVIPSKGDEKDAAGEAMRKVGNLQAGIEEMKSRGMLKGDSQYELEEIKPTRSWDDLLSEAVASNMTREDFSMRRWSKPTFVGQGLIVGGMWVEERKCVFACDMSGSMSDEDIRRAMGIVASISGTVRFLQFDTEVQKDTLVRNGEWEGKREATGRGGTSFKPLFQYVQKLVEEGEEVPVLIVFTDSFGDSPTVSDYPASVVWLCTTDSHPAGDKSGQFIRYQP